MESKKDILAEIDRLFSLRGMVEAYEEIAASRMRRIRDSVLKNRDFLFGLNEVFHQVQKSYKSEIERLMKTKKLKDKSKITFLKKNGKKIYILLTSNSGLYGSIIRKTFNLFLENIKKENCDAAVIGRLGKEMFEAEKLNSNVTFFNFPDNKIDYDQFKKIMDHILQYEEIDVFHGQFQTVITQKPVMSSISGTEIPGIKKEEVDKAQAKQINLRYLFEPSLEKIMAFFETEIFSSIFEQTIHESELAKFSSRMVVLDQAVENIRGSLTKTEYLMRKFKHRRGNRKQLSRLSGMMLWNRS
ncbi:MAG: F0F1 ATP synthase subunit gamma [Patescibacteria group bacterium]|nr:F0F1 ATP synthase subunit gamma [Patescibacteria group bacterium]